MAFIKRRFSVGPDDEGKRLDNIIRTILPRMALPAVYKLIRSGDARLNGSKAGPETRVRCGDELLMRISDAEPLRGSAVDKAAGDVSVDAVGKAAGDVSGDAVGKAAGDVSGDAAGDISSGVGDSTEEAKRDRLAAAFRPLILYEDRDLALVNKPRGMLSHGPGGLDELAAAYYADAVRGSLAFSPAPLHRLDRNTSGIVAVSAGLEGARRFSCGLREGLVVKTYLALLLGDAPDRDLWEDTLVRDGHSRTSGLASGDESEGGSGRYAKSELRTLARAGLGGGRTLSLARIAIYTGRTHQIRAQARARGFPLYGDLKYGGGTAPGGYVLHAWRMAIDPSLGLGAPPIVVAPLPAAAEALVLRYFGADWAKEAEAADYRPF